MLCLLPDSFTNRVVYRGICLDCQSTDCRAPPCYADSFTDRVFVYLSGPSREQAAWRIKYGPLPRSLRDLMSFDMFHTICLFISPDLDGHRAFEMKRARNVM